jgi:hypothetical protein
MTVDYLNTPAPYSRTVEALLEHERVIVDRPALVRARVLARARDSMKDADRISAKSSRSPYFIRVVVAAAAGVVVMVSAAAAYQMLWRTSVTTPPAPSSHKSPLPLAVSASTPESSPAPIAAASTTDEHSGTPSASHRPGRAAVEELRLLDRARQSDARADYAGVLSVAAEHERRYPNGRLAEEREVLRVRALVGLGRGGEARQTASRFRQQFPRSVLLRKVDDMLAPSK